MIVKRDPPLAKIVLRSRLSESTVVETPWASPRGGTLYRLENSPWYAAWLSWLDVVRCETPDPEGFPEAVELVEPSGHTTFRLLFGSLVDPKIHDSTLRALGDVGATYEGTGGSREGFYAVDVAPELDRTPVVEVLEDAGRRGVLEWHEGGTPEFLQRCDRASKTNNGTVHHKGPLGDEPACAMLMADVSGHELLEANYWERLWARRRNGGRFEVLNAPFYLYGLSFGDVVEAIHAENRAPVLRKVIEHSGHRVIRIVVFDRGNRAELVENLERMGTRTEEQAGGARLIAVDLPCDDVVEAVIAYLQPLEDRDELSWESGWQ